MAEEDPWHRASKGDRDGRARGYEVGAGERRVWSSRGMEIHRYVFQPQSCRSRRAAKRMRGKRGRPEGVEGTWVRRAGTERERERERERRYHGVREEKWRDGWQAGGRDGGRGGEAGGWPCREGEEKRRRPPAAATTARLNANSFIDWNSKFPSPLLTPIPSPSPEFRFLHTRRLLFLLLQPPPSASPFPVCPCACVQSA
jgi:hypothetical protein